MAADPVLVLINFQKTLRDGRLVAAADLLDLVLARLDGEFARVTDTATLPGEFAT